MATVDNGIIVRTEDPWLVVKPRCPYCGHMEQNDWNLISVGKPQNPYGTHSVGVTCGKCYKIFRITSFYG